MKKFGSVLDQIESKVAGWESITVMDFNPTSMIELINKVTPFDETKIKTIKVQNDYANFGILEKFLMVLASKFISNKAALIDEVLAEMHTSMYSDWTTKFVEIQKKKKVSVKKRYTVSTKHSEEAQREVGKAKLSLKYSQTDENELKLAITQFKHNFKVTAVNETRSLVLKPVKQIRESEDDLILLPIVVGNPYRVEPSSLNKQLRAYSIAELTYVVRVNNERYRFALIENVKERMVAIEASELGGYGKIYLPESLVNKYQVDVENTEGI